MSDLYKPVSDKTIADVQRANDAAWDSGEFRHADAEQTPFGIGGANSARNLHQATEKEHQQKFEATESREAHRARTNIGRRGAGELHSEREKKSIAHVAGSDAKQVHLPRTAKRTWRRGVWS